MTNDNGTDTTATAETDIGHDAALEAAFLAHSDVMAQAAEKIFDGYADATRLPREAARVGMAAALISDCQSAEEVEQLAAAFDSMIVEHLGAMEAAADESVTGEAAQ
jgi:hypothetical protein